MRNRIARAGFLMGLVFSILACSSVSGLAGATPTVWIPEPWISVPGQPEAAATSAALSPDATLPVPFPTGVSPLEVSILKCQNAPSAGIVPAQAPVVLVWGWSTDNEAKRDEFISIASFVLRVDSQEQDMNGAQRILESGGTVRWKLAVGQLPAGSHEVRLTTTLARGFAESIGTYPAGQLEDEICQLVVRP
jgi:hypothetical protein